MKTMKEWVLREGMDVIAADGEKVGEVQEALGESFSVKEGWFFPKEHIIPSSVITSVDDDTVRINVTKDQALDQDWGTGATTDTAGTWGNAASPVDASGSTETWGSSGAAPGETVADAGVYSDTGLIGADASTDANAAYDTAPSSDESTYSGANRTDAYVGGDTPAEDLEPVNPVAATETDATAAYDRGATASDTDQDTVRVPLSEEELVATRRPVDRGTVRVQRDVVTEEQSLDVPVTEEEVHVSRRVVDRDLASDDDAFQEGTIEIPVRGEEVSVEKRAHVTGEVEISKRAKTRTERVSDTIRREEAHIVDDNGIVVDDDSTPVTDDGISRRS